MFYFRAIQASNTKLPFVAYTYLKSCSLFLNNNSDFFLFVKICYFVKSNLGFTNLWFQSRRKFDMFKYQAQLFEAW
jgi:hypothetical protein